MADAIVLKGLTKTFGDTVAVRELDLVVPEGALYGVIGPNGAGKTTTIRMILSIQMPDRGVLSVLGHRSAMEAKDRIGYLPEERGLYKRMRVGHFLEYMARLKGDDGPDLGARVKRWLERVDLGGVAGKRCEELSKGMQQKVQFLTAVIHRPSLIILDEPFSGLDPVNQRLLRDLVSEEHARGATVLFSTHVMVYAEQLCDHIVMIHRGLKVLDDNLDSIRSRFAPRSILFEPLDRTVNAGALAGLPGVQGIQQDGETWELTMAPAASPGAVMQAVAAAIPPSRLELRRPTLEDIFIDIVSGEGADTGTLRAAVREHDAARTGGLA